MTDKKEKLNDSCMSQRNYGVDLLRIVSMFMVVLLHVLGRGGILDATDSGTPHYYIAWFLETCAMCAVNCYALISGYVGFGSKHRFGSVINLTFSVLFYVIAGTIVGYFVLPDVSKGSIISSLLHLRSGGYWYYRAYLGAFFFFPLLNLAVEKLERKKIKVIIVALVVLYSFMTTASFSDLFSVQGGYSPVWLMVIYLVGAYVKKYGIGSGKSSSKYALFYLLISMASFVSMMLLGLITTKAFGKPVGDRVLVAYTSPTVVLAALFLLIAFSNMKTGKVVKRVTAVCAPLTFGVYLAHMQYFAREWLEGRFAFVLQYNPLMFFLAFIGITIAIYIAGSMVDYVRSIIFKVMGVNKFTKFISAKIDRN